MCSTTAQSVFMRCYHKLTYRKVRHPDMNLPKDPAILVSFLNTKLRDFYPSLE
jgi:hypothetical protein